MYPQSKFSGYERGSNTQAWQPAQPWPQHHLTPPPPAAHPAWPQPQGEVQWPPPLRVVPQHEPFLAYQSPSKGRAWKAKLFVLAAVFGAGAYARPFLETHFVGLPGDSWVVASYAQAQLPSWVPFFGAPVETTHLFHPEAPHAGIVTSPLPTPRVAPVPTAAAPAEPAMPAVKAAVPEATAPVVAKVEETVAESPPARHASRKTHIAKPGHTRVAMRAPVVPAHERQPVSEAEPAAPEHAAPQAAAPAAPAPSKPEPAPAPDPLEGLLRRAISSSAPLAAKTSNTTNRMRFPDEKPAATRVAPAPVPAPKPDSITGDVTSAAEAAAKANAAAATSTPKASAVALPKIPGKVRVSGDPLEGLNGKEIEGKRQGKGAKRARR